MKKLNIKNLNTNQKIWLADKYLTYQYIDKLKYGDYTELKEELSEDIAEVKEVVEFSEFNTEDGKKLSLQFDNSDLYFSIHKANIKVIGKKENDK